MSETLFELPAEDAPARTQRVTSKGIAPGDVVEIDKKGRRFHALVTELQQLESGRFVLPDRPTAPRDMVLGDGRFWFRQTADLSPGKHTFQIENRTGERGRFWFVQYPFGFEPHLVKYEPFLSGKRLLLTPSFGELYKAQLVDEGESLKVLDMTYLSEAVDSTVRKRW